MRRSAALRMSARLPRPGSPRLEAHRGGGVRARDSVGESVPGPSTWPPRRRPAAAAPSGAGDRLAPPSSGRGASPEPARGTPRSSRPSRPGSPSPACAAPHSAKTKASVKWLPSARDRRPTPGSGPAARRRRNAPTQRRGLAHHIRACGTARRPGSARRSAAARRRCRSPRRTSTLAHRPRRPCGRGPGRAPTGTRCPGCRGRRR